MHIQMIEWSIILEYSEIVLRQFTHSVEIKREIPFFSFGFAHITEVRHIQILFQEIKN